MNDLPSKPPDDRGSHPVEGPPSGFYVIVPPRSDAVRIDLARAAAALKRAWLTLAVAVLVGAAGAAGIALSMRNIYRSQTLVFPVVPGESGMERALGGQLGSIASLVGIDLGGRSEGREASYATLTSPGLAREFISANDLLPVMYASRWDASRKQWRPEATVPTLEDAVLMFRSQVCAISEDRRTGIVTVRIDWFDPKIAADWANSFVALANERLRTEAIQKSQRSISYLEGEVSKTDNVELKQAIYRLIESQVNNAMFANVQREYAFRTIDRAVPSDPKRKVSPKRALMTLAGGAGIGLLTVGWLLWRRRREWLV